MTAVTRPRGPLPPRVYWTRRIVVVVLALALVYVVAHLLGGGGGGGASAAPMAAQSSAQSSAPPSAPSTSVTSPAATAAAAPTGAPTGAGAAVAAALPAPSGTCSASDVVVAPSVEQPSYAGRSVVLTMTLTTRTSPACTWTVSSHALAVKVTSGQERIWSTQDCVRAVRKQVVVVRRNSAVTVPVSWNGQRSDAECSRATPWAEPGYYHVVAAAFGSQPVDEQFQLMPPPRPTVTATPTPDPSATPSTTLVPSPSPSPSHRARTAAAEPSGSAAPAASGRTSHPTASGSPQH